MPNVDYAPRALSADEARQWNHRHDSTAGRRVREYRTVEPVTAGDLEAMGLTESPTAEAHRRVLAMMAETGMSAKRAVEIVEAAMARRSPELRKYQYSRSLPGDREQFAATYSKGRTWTPSHHRSRIEDTSPARIIQGRLG